MESPPAQNAPYNSGIQALTPEAEVRQCLDAFAREMCVGKLESIMAFYAPEVLAYDMMPPLQIVGIEEYRKSWQQCFTSYFKFPMAISYREQRIQVNGDIAFAHGLLHTEGTSKMGKKMEATLRSTICLKRLSSGWKIVHEHNSVPLDMDSGKGLMNLQSDVSSEKADKPTNVNRNHDE